MSLRETKLCDTLLHNWNNNPVQCGELAVATCALCRSDVCKSHALHPQGGMLLRCDSIVPNATGSQDSIYSPGSTQVTPYPQVGFNNVLMIRLQVCAGCRRSLGQDHAIFESLQALEKPFIELLAAAITAKALETK